VGRVDARPREHSRRSRSYSWAEAHIDEYLDGDEDEPHGDRVYVLYVKDPREDRYLHIAGWDPTRSSDAPPEWNFSRRHPS
jgi:hypothetical protein